MMMKRLFVVSIIALLGAVLLNAQPATENVTLEANLSPSNIVPPVEGQNVTGDVTLRINTTSNQTSQEIDSAIIDYDLTLYSELVTNFTSVTIHRGAAGEQRSSRSKPRFAGHRDPAGG